MIAEYPTLGNSLFVCLPLLWAAQPTYVSQKICSRSVKAFYPQLVQCLSTTSTTTSNLNGRQWKISDHKAPLTPDATDLPHLSQLSADIQEAKAFLLPGSSQIMTRPRSPSHLCCRMKTLPLSYVILKLTHNHMVFCYYSPSDLFFKHIHNPENSFRLSSHPNIHETIPSFYSKYHVPFFSPSLSTMFTSAKEDKVIYLSPFTTTSPSTLAISCSSCWDLFLL